MSAAPAYDDSRRTKGDDYVLARGYHASTRLTLQHLIWKSTFGFNIHPNVSLPEKPAIAEVALGNGIWAVEVAAEIPGAEIHGFDVELAQAPPKEWLPESMTLHRWNVFEDPPEEFVGKFDLLHVRLVILVLGLKREDVIKRFLSLLKPGGYIQWDEYDFVKMVVKKTSLSNKSTAMDQLLHALEGVGEGYWTAEIPGLLSNAGFTEVAMDRFDDLRQWHRYINDTNMMFFEEFAAGLARNNQSDRASHLLQLIPEAYAETLQGVTMTNPRIVCTARKPLR